MNYNTGILQAEVKKIQFKKERVQIKFPGLYSASQKKSKDL